MHAPESLLLQHYPDVFNYALHLTGSRLDAEDLTQSTMLRALTAKYKESGNFKTWLLVICRNLYINDYNRSKLVTFVNIEDIHGLNDRASYAAELAVIREGLAKLPPRRRKTVELLEQGFKYREIAEITGIGMQYIRSFIFYTRERISYLQH